MDSNKASVNRPTLEFKKAAKKIKQGEYNFDTEIIFIGIIGFIKFWGKNFLMSYRSKKLSEFRAKKITFILIQVSFIPIFIIKHYYRNCERLIILRNKKRKILYKLYIW